MQTSSNIMADYGWTEASFAPTSKERRLDLATFLARVAHIDARGLPVCLIVKPLSEADDLLMLEAEPAADFTHLASNEKTAELYAEGHRYHISICFKWELPADGTAAYERIRQKYHGRTGLLGVKVGWTVAYLCADLSLSADILQDPDISGLHAAGRYAERELHMSL